jgi:L1 cell adhesion molecule like protein
MYEGECARVEDNSLLGRFELSGILLAHRGMPQITTHFKVNVDSILSVSASADKVTPTPTPTLTPEQSVTIITVTADKGQ